MARHNDRLMRTRVSEVPFFHGCVRAAHPKRYWKGEKRFKASKTVSTISGFNVNISDAPGTQLPKQLKHAANVLRRDASEFRRLKRLKLHAVIDFAVEVKIGSGPVSWRVPNELLASFSMHGVDLEISYYGEES